MLNVRKLLTKILNKLITTTATITSSVTVSTGSLLSAVVTKCGNVVTLRMAVYNTTSVASGSNIFVATIPAAYRPIDYATGVGYYSNHACPFQISSAGTLTVRNAGSSAFSGSSASSTLWIAATYIVKD